MHLIWESRVFIGRSLNLTSISTKIQNWNTHKTVCTKWFPEMRIDYGMDMEMPIEISIEVGLLCVHVVCILCTWTNNEICTVDCWLFIALKWLYFWARSAKERTGPDLQCGILLGAYCSYEYSYYANDSWVEIVNWIAFICIARLSDSIVICDQIYNLGKRQRNRVNHGWIAKIWKWTLQQHSWISKIYLILTKKTP